MKDAVDSAVREPTVRIGTLWSKTYPKPNHVTVQSAQSTMPQSPRSLS